MPLARTQSDYLDRLDATLARGVRRLPPPVLARHGRYLAAAQRPDGGFPGRRGGSDLYYTTLGLRAAALLHPLPLGALWAGAGRYLHRRGLEARALVDCFGLLASARLLRRHVAQPPSAVADALRPVLASSRAEDGGFAAAPGGPGSVYHTFLAAVCCPMLGMAMPEPERAVRFVLSCRCSDGGFGDAPGSQAGGTNPTAAAVAFLNLLGVLDAETAAAAAGFLAARQRPDGGVAAHATAPVADLLSTFTALVALRTCQATGRVKRGRAARFARALALPGGGFRGGPGDDAADVEYTFYGLGTLGLLALELERRS